MGANSLVRVILCTLLLASGAQPSYAGKLDDFEKSGVTQVKSHRPGGRYDPLWREVWVKEEPEEEPEEESGPRSSGYNLHGYSLEVQKRIEASQARSRSYRPWIKRTGSLAIVYRPRLSGRRTSTLFAQNMAANLPQFQFNAKKDRWEAPLEEIEVAYEALRPHVVLSRGVQEYLAEGGVA